MLLCHCLNRTPLGLGALFLAVLALPCAAADDLRAPSVPLVTHDPYFSIWSPADRLTDVETTHWTGKPHPLHSAIRVDGTAFRLMGMQPSSLPALPQESVTVLPTRTIYRFSNTQVGVTLTFLTPALPSKLEVLSRPLTYLTWEVASRDGQPHDVALSFDASPLVAVNTPDQAVVGDETRGSGWRALRAGTVEQPVLDKQGDDLRIDWGHLYVIVGDAVRKTGAGPAAWKTGFRSAAGDPFASAVAENFTATPAETAPVLQATCPLGRVGPSAVTASLLLAYDDGVSLRYFDSILKPYWRAHGLDAAGLFASALRDHAALRQECAAFDDQLMADLTKVGGEAYAQIAALAYRETLAGCKLVADAAGAPLLFPKENHSNGCLATVDVIYPMMPFFYVLNPTLARASLVPVLDYAASPRWKFDYAPHDLGRYPHATGQVYGGGELTDERQMPVEESANMILLVAGLLGVDGRSDLANRYWPQLEQWARYLEQKGFDPENQLCTDDFAGHLAHNVNLSAKAIVALGAYAQLCDKRGAGSEAKRIRQLAETFAARWEKEALDGDHYRLAFDRPGTWSQKYNLVWDRVLGLHLFSAATLRREMDFYLAHQLDYGLPLDSRSTYTKLDWTIWTSALTGRRADHDALVARVHKFIGATPDRVPLTDWYFTDTAKLRGFIARPVLGGVFMPALCDDTIVRTWTARADTYTGTWAPLPLARYTTLSPTGETATTTWKYTTTEPPASWTTADFADSSWQTGAAAFFHRPTAGEPKRRPANVPLHTNWTGTSLWLRHTFTLDQVPTVAPRLRITHSAPVDVYLNGKLVLRATGNLRGYENLALPADSVAALRRGENVLALHVSGDGPNNNAPGYVDAGLLAPVTP